MVEGRTGRRPGKPDTRAHILAVAEAVFARDGFAEASVRGIAREAGVDPALVHRYFGSKRDLFAAAIRLGFDVKSLTARVTASGGRDGVGHRAISTITAVWESPMGRTLLESVRTNPTLMGLMAGFMFDVIVEAAISLGYSRREAELRAALVEATMLGLVQARFALAIKPVASMSRDDLIRVYAPILQRLMGEDLGLRGLRGKSSPAAG